MIIVVHGPPCIERDGMTYCRRCKRHVGRIVGRKHVIRRKTQDDWNFDCRCGEPQHVGSLRPTTKT